MIGTASAPSSQNGRLEASQVGPRSQMNGTCTIAASGIQCASAGIGSVPTAGNRPPTSTKLQMYGIVKPWPAASERATAM